jgi:hypothetical protein
VQNREVAGQFQHMLEYRNGIATYVKGKYFFKGIVMYLEDISIISKYKNVF